MRVFIISRGYPSERYVTNGIFEFDQAKALAKDGHEVIFLVCDMRSFRRKRKFGRESFTKDGVQIEALNIPCGKIPKSLLCRIRSSAIKKLYQKSVQKYGKPDIVHSHFLEISYCTAKVLKSENVPLVMTEHLSTLNNRTIPENLIQLGKNTYRHYDKVIAVGKEIADTIERNFGIKAEIIPNIADTDSFTLETTNETAKKPKETFRVISVGALIKRKHMDLLIKAFCKFSENCPGAYLDIYGKGAEKENLQNLIAENGREKQIILHGARPRTEIAQQMKQADCFALASDVETFGVVYIEAMAMGLPVIATKSGGPENFVNSENGMLIEAGSEEVLVNALKTMYNNSSTYNRMKIRDYVLNNFSPSAVAEKIGRVYREVTDKNTAM